MNGSKRMVPLLDLRATLLTMITGRVCPPSRVEDSGEWGMEEGGSEFAQTAGIVDGGGSWLREEAARVCGRSLYTDAE